MGNAKILFQVYKKNVSASILISDTTFSYGSSEFGSGLQVIICSEVRCSLTIANSFFYKNEAKHGSHFIMQTKGNTPLPINLCVLNSHFTEAKKI